MTHISGNIYRVGLIMYFDAVNGNPGAIDDAVVVHIFNKRTDELVRSIQIPLVADEFVEYTQPDCAVGDLVTRRIYYATTVNFDSEDYTEPEGYYMIWERCCRNRTIDNIISPEDAGQTFYLEFPPLRVNGQRFINSSPRLFPPLSDYACANQPFTFNFGGSDDDGDQLVYRLSVPIQGNSSPDPNFIVPPPLPAPYERVTFVPGIDVTNMIPGSPPLTIDAQTGILNLSAAAPGLYVFAVTVEEYRAGRKIGEVRREFQLLVLDCPVADPPELVFFPEGESEPYQEGDVIQLRPGQLSCGEVQITDPNFDTQINGTIEPVNFAGVGQVLASSPNISGTINGTSETYTQELCLQGCPDPETPFYDLRIIIGDNSCSVPLFDTLQIRVEIDTTSNVPPDILTDLEPASGDEACQTAELTLGETLNFELQGLDQNQDTITLSAGNLIAGMNFTEQTGLPPLTGNFSWTPDCDAIPEGQDSLVQRVEFYVEDGNRCIEPTFDTLCVEITLRREERENEAPVLSAELEQNDAGVYTDSVFVGETFDFDVLTSDADADSVAIAFTGEGFDPAAIGATLSPLSGTAPLSSAFRWTTDCENLDEPQTPKTYRFRAVVTDFDFCGIAQEKDTIDIELKVVPRENIPPEVSTDFPFDTEANAYCDTIRLTETLTFTLFGDDADGDSLLLTGAGIGFDLEALGMRFDPVAGFPQLEGAFRWETSCDLAETITFGVPYELEFVVRDYNFCPENDRFDTLRAKVVVLPADPPSEPPFAEATLPQIASEPLTIYRDTIQLEEVLTFTVTGNDPENDVVRLEAFGNGFTLPEVGMSFPEAQTGNAPLTGDFRWQPTCDLLPAGGGDTTFVVDFIVTEIGTCGDLQSDTIRTELVLIADPTNNPPEVLTDLAVFDTITRTYTLEAIVGEPITFEVNGEDIDLGQVFLNGDGEGFTLEELGMEFEDVSGIAPVASTFRWQTDCAILNGEAERSFELVFSINDISDACNDDLYDQTRVRIVIVDNPDEITFEPYNVFTPNGDGFNDTFTLPIAPNSCRNPFERIVIFNRWGREVFSDTRENFSWDGGDFPDGVYFYRIIYEQDEFKGTVSLIRGEE